MLVRPGAAWSFFARFPLTLARGLVGLFVEAAPRQGRCHTTIKLLPHSAPIEWHGGRDPRPFLDVA